MTVDERIGDVAGLAGFLLAALAAVTLLAFLAGLPLWLDAVRHLHPLAASGGVRSIFVVAWLLLLALVAWQLALVWRVAALRRKIPA